MQAREIMTSDVVAVSPDTPTTEIAKLLLDRKISALPVVDGSGMVVGMVSEGDLIGRNDADRHARRDWWLALIAEGEALNPDFLASLRHPELKARDVMSAPVVRVTETTDTAEIARLLATYRIKRVPVVRDGKMIGIVSRADLLRALTAEQTAQPGSEHITRARGLLADAIAAIDNHFIHHRNQRIPATPAPSDSLTSEPLSAAKFRDLVADFEKQKTEHRNDDARAATDRRRQEVKTLIDQHITDRDWNATLHRACRAAEHGEKEVMLLRFPSELCNDGGRAINAPLPDWPKTLRGEAAEMYLRWESELKMQGFHLTARVLDFPAGKPGDIGLFLSW
jgi:CBS domain-containing protein